MVPELKKLQRIYEVLSEDQSLVLGKIIPPSSNPRLPFSRISPDAYISGYWINLPVAPKEPCYNGKSIYGVAAGLAKKIGCGDESVRTPDLYRNVYYPAYVDYEERGGVANKLVNYTAEVASPHNILGIDMGSSILEDGVIKLKRKKAESKPILNNYSILVYPDEKIMSLASPKKDGRVKLKKGELFISPECERLAENFS